MKSDSISCLAPLLWISDSALLDICLASSEYPCVPQGRVTTCAASLSDFHHVASCIILGIYHLVLFGKVPRFMYPVQCWSLSWPMHLHYTWHYKPSAMAAAHHLTHGKRTVGGLRDNNDHRVQTWVAWTLGLDVWWLHLKSTLWMAAPAKPTRGPQSRWRDLLHRGLKAAGVLEDEWYILCIPLYDKLVKDIPRVGTWSSVTKSSWL